MALPLLSSLRRSKVGTVLKFALTSVDLRWQALRRRCGARPSVLFEIHNTIGFDAQEPVIGALLEGGRVDVFVSGGEERGIPQERLLTLMNVGARLLPGNAIRHRHFDTVVITDTRLINSWRSPHYVFLHHGSSYGNLARPYAFDVIAAGDASFLLAIHPEEVRAAKERFGTAITSHVRTTGQPKLDRLQNAIDRNKRRDAFLRSLNLDPQRPTVLCLSHWSPQSLFRTCGEAVVEVLRRQNGINVLVAAHHKLWDEPSPVAGSSFVDWLSWIEDMPHMRLLYRPSDIHALYEAADLAISDHTSATMEYAILHRPMIVFRHPEWEYSDDNLDAMLRDTARIFVSADQLPDLLAATLADMAIDHGRRATFLGACFHHLGNSRFKAAAAIEEIATTGVLASHK